MEWTWKQKLGVVLGITVIMAPMIIFSNWGLGKLQTQIDEAVATWDEKGSKEGKPFPEWTLTWQDRLAHIYLKTFRPEEAIEAFEKAESLYARQRMIDELALCQYFRATAYEAKNTLPDKTSAWTIYYYLDKKYPQHPKAEAIDKALVRLHKHRDRSKLK